MKISYNWLKNYLPINLPAEEVAKHLTDCGLEVEHVEKHQTVKGGLKGMVVGEVKTKEKHPDADKLSVTTVDIGSKELLHIVCGASNVAAGQKVIVATVGATLYPTTGEPFQIKKSKIRGAVSEGMICAEDEIGLGTSHEGIMVLTDEVKVGTAASAYFKLEDDYVFEIGLTPNRADAASHIGVARDLAAVLALTPEFSSNPLPLSWPAVDAFQVASTKGKIEVIVEDAKAAPRYSGVSISNIQVKESPEWLKIKLAAIGLRSINNIVDVTNYVLHETGQPLHAFDADKIAGKKIIVKKVDNKTKFKTLDEVERELSADDLMICDAEKPLCIAGIFGGIESGVTANTTNLFLESAWFDALHVRKSAKLHNLKTDASFRFERGTDPDLTVYALKRAALLIVEIAEGEISSEIFDHYPVPAKPVTVPFSFANCTKLIGKSIDHITIKNILTSLGIEIATESNDTLSLSVPPYKVDVQREADVIEEILRIYGYNNIEMPIAVRSSLSFIPKPDVEKAQNTIADLLSSNGFNEILSNSLTKADYYTDASTHKSESLIKLLNPLSTDLNVMRQTLLFGGLEAIAYNQNRKNSELKLYEFGKIYSTYQTAEGASGFNENKSLALFITGRKVQENWNAANDHVTLYTLKGHVNNVLNRLGIVNFKATAAQQEFITEGLTYGTSKKTFVTFGSLKKSLLKQFDIKQAVYYADFNWEALLAQLKNTKIEFKEVPRFPEVRRDLALVIDKNIQFEQLEQLAYQAEKNYLKEVRLFDVYEGDKIESTKKSYALGFVLQDETATLQDKQIDKIMEKLITTFSERAGAVIRS